MTGYSVLHIILAALCGCLASLHFVLWQGLKGPSGGREAQVQLWMSIACLGFFLLEVSCAGSSSAARGMLGPGYLWLIPALLCTPLLLTAPEKASSFMVTRPLHKDHRWMGVAGPILGMIRAADMALLAHYQATHGQTVTIEGVANTLKAPTFIPFYAYAFFSGAMGGTEALDEVGRKSRLGILMLSSNIISMILVLREVLISVGVLPGPTLVGVCGLPFLALSSWIVAGRQVRAVRSLEVRGQELGGYRLIRWLTQGGMGDLYLAARVGPGGFEREVAVKKIIADDDPEATERFLHEARLAATLRHPNVVAVHDLGKTKGGYFMAMEYLPGVTLSAFRNRLKDLGVNASGEVIVGLGLPIARALAHAHAQGVVHRDISPQNVMITFEGEVKVIDFGIAREEGGARHTQSGRVVGKSAYMAPERMRGNPGSPATDVFSLGVVLWELAAGARPYRGRNPRELAQDMFSGRRPVLPPDTRVPRGVEELLLACLAIDPEARPSAEVLAGRLGLLSERLPRTSLERMVREICSDAWADEQNAARLAVRSSQPPMARLTGT